MKFITFMKDEMEQVGILNQSQTAVASIAKAGLAYQTMNELIEKITQEEWEHLKTLEKKETEWISLLDTKKCPPIPVPKQDLICLGINYAAHAQESARYKKEAFERDRAYPVYFSKRVNRAVADGDEIEGHFELVHSLDYEAELAIIIGREAKNVKPEEVYDYLFGYTIVNDVSARNVQTRHKQWYFGKSMDGFTPMGPAIVTKDEIAYPPKLAISSRVNGELRQNSNTELLLFGIDYIVSELSKGMTLLPGTVIITGTPAGVGMGMVPPVFLKAVDVVECEIEGIGKITNRVKEEK